MSLTLEEYANTKKLPVEFLQKLGLEGTVRRGQPVVLIPYGNASGDELCVRIRAAMDGYSRFFWEPGAKPILYGLWRRKQQRSTSMCLVEGESDCQTLWFHEFPAVGLPGATSWNEKEWAKYFDSFEIIYVVLEPDKGGEAVQAWLSTSKIRDRARLVRLDGAKDASALYLSDPDNFKQNWKAAMKAALPWSDIEVQEEEEQTPALTRTSLLLSLAEKANFFHTPDGEVFAEVPVGEHKENWPLRSRQFRRWLLRGYYRETKSAPKSNTLQEALGVLESKASFDGPECPAFVRLAETENKIYLDLCDADWRVVEIDARGWRLCSDVSVKFRRARGMGPLPLPTSNGSVDQLRPFINVASDADRVLLLEWLIAALRGRGPFPILVEHGEQGSAKSTTARVLRALVDPSNSPLRSEPRELRDLMISASNGWVVSLDNISRIPLWLSDALCRFSTGGGFSTRELYSDSDEVIFNAQRPVIVNGIEEIAVRGDLLDRSLILYLPAIPEDERQPEDKFWRDFETVRSAILGALLDVVSSAIRRLPKVRLSNMPRLADFAVWATAAERGLGCADGEFLQAYTRNVSSANDLALEASPIVEPVRRLVADGDFQGTASDLLKALADRTDESTRRQKGWPPNAQGVSNALRRLAPNLRKTGIEVTFSKGKDRRRQRLIVLRNIASDASTASTKPDAGKLGRQ